MIKLLLSIVILATSLYAHGGKYRGPADVVPPGPGAGNGGRPSGPTTGGPGGRGPSAPIPGPGTGPATGGPGNPAPGNPGGPGGPRTGGRGMPIEDDLTTWVYWWEFNKDPFIMLRDAVNKGGPSTGSDDFYLGNTRKGSHNSLKPTVLDKINILADLKKAMESSDHPDIITACMISMAKIGFDHPDFKLVDVFKSQLKSKNQEVRETAILAMGIAGISESDQMDILIQVALGKEVK